MTRKLSELMKLIFGLAPLALVALTGCMQVTPLDPFPEDGRGTGGVYGTGIDAAGEPVFQVGDKIAVVFSDTGTVIPPFEDKIKDDETITLHMNEVFKAAGKSRGVLQREIRDRYVPGYYKQMTVTVKAEERSFTISGEVRRPGSLLYTGPTTVTRAITTAGDFTDFANRKNVQLIRPGFKPQRVDCTKAIVDPSKDPAVYPNDTIIVKRRWI